MMRRTERRKRDQKLKKNKKINLTVTNSELHIFSLLQNCQSFHNAIGSYMFVRRSWAAWHADRGLTACTEYNRGIRKKAADTGFGARKIRPFVLKCFLTSESAVWTDQGRWLQRSWKVSALMFKSALDYCNGLAPIQKFFIISKKSAFSHWFC